MDDDMANWELVEIILSHMRTGSRYKQSEIIQLDDVTNNWKLAGVWLSIIKKWLEIQTEWSHPTGFWIDGGDFFHLVVGIIQSLFIQRNTDHLIHYLRGGKILLVFMVMVEVVLVLVPPTSPPRKSILAETGIVWGLGRLRVIS